MALLKHKQYRDFITFFNCYAQLISDLQGPVEIWYNFPICTFLILSVLRLFFFLDCKPSPFYPSPVPLYDAVLHSTSLFPFSAATDHFYKNAQLYKPNPQHFKANLKPAGRGNTA